jgi:hypothetical protein
MRGPRQDKDPNRLQSIPGGRTPQVRDDGFSPPASLSIPVEDYQAVRRTDLLRIRHRLLNPPRRTSAWANAGWAFFGLGGGAVFDAAMSRPPTPLPSFFIWFVAGSLLFFATFCWIAQITVTETELRFDDEVLADLEQTIAGLEDWGT